MASEVLQKTRKINKTLQTSGGSNVSFDLLAGTLGVVLSSNVYVLSIDCDDENINVKRGYFAYKTSHAHSDK